jgi:KUP system potassium uptake protein
MSPVGTGLPGSPAPAPSTNPTKDHKLALTLGSVGVVYGDIGTSPLYALREGLAATGSREAPAVVGAVSLLLWLLILIATLKYVLLMLRADNRGEGGTLSLLALSLRALGTRPRWLLALGIAGTALFFGDAMITPAISVLSAVEGLDLVAPAFAPIVVPLALAILLGLFLMQRRGTAQVSRLFAPVMLVWFAVMAGLGAWHVSDAPQILAALSPLPGLRYLAQHGTEALPVLGAVFLAITGAEALYADMGHFGRDPIRLAWGLLVLPSLALSYLGQGAMVLRQPDTADNPFFLLAPDWALPGLVGLAMLATIIASQAVITGAFSFAYQAVQLGLLPRLAVRHTSETQEGQIYMRQINALLLISVGLLVLTFRSSEALATAYGIAVTGEMLITTVLATLVFRLVWCWSLPLVAVVVLPLAIVETGLLAANLQKFTDGGWLPATVALALATLMAVWVRGTDQLAATRQAQAVPLAVAIRSLAGSDRVTRVPGTAVFLTPEPDAAPGALLHNIKHNHVLHARNLIVAVRIANRPHIGAGEQIELGPEAGGVQQVKLTFGYMDVPNVPLALRQAVRLDIMDTSFFLDRRSFKIVEGTGWRGMANRFFRGLSHFAADAHEHYRIPSDRIVELGSQVVL